MKKVVALVPIKLNNRRFPNKNIIPFHNGLNLVELTLKKLSKSKLIDDIYLYCSDSEVEKYCTYENTHFLIREKKLDSDNTSMNKVIESFLAKVESDIYVLAHVTSPLITLESINLGLESVMSGSYDSALSVEEFKGFYWRNNIPNYTLNDVERTQDLEPIYIETSGFYVFTRDLFLSRESRVSLNHKKCIVDQFEAIDIDFESDFIIAQKLIKEIEK
jgi:CMP-N-acetylneuraminic acid synthetase